MKNIFVKLVVAFLLIVCGAATVAADGGEPVPLCYPRPCPVK